MRLLRVLLAGLLGALCLVVVSAAPSFACSCAVASTPEHVDGADVVVTGTLVDQEPPPKRAVMSSGDPATYTFVVDRAYKGDVAGTVTVLSAVSGASCGLEGMIEGDRYVLFASKSGGGGPGDEALWAGLCGGTAPWSAELEAEVVQAAGPGSEPTPGATPVGDDGTSHDPPGDDTDRPTGAGPEGSEGGFLAVPVALVAGAGLVLLAGAYWLRLLLRG